MVNNEDSKGGGGGRSNILLFSENRGAFSTTRKYVVEKEEEEGMKIVVQDDNKIVVGGSWIQSTKLTLKQVFLPHGYPNSVSEDYVSYQIWDTMQAFASSITGALATEAVMKGVGVGELGRTPLAAALTWLLKSGSGHIGQILFAWSKGTSLDHDCKMWRLFADGLNDIATFIDLIAPLFPADLVVFVFCSASVFRALVGVAGSGTRAAVTQHQARMNNMADVSAKDGSQETLINLLALITSLILLPIVSGKKMLVWMLFVIFTFIHLFANYRAVKSLKIESFNRSRLLICLHDFLKFQRLPSVKSANDRESVFLGQGLKDRDVCGMNISLGVSLEEAIQNIPFQKRRKFIERLLRETSKPFIIIPRYQEGSKKGAVNVILHENVQSNQILEAFCRSILYAAKANNSETKESLDAMDDEISKDWDNFQKLAITQGFTLCHAQLQTGEWRAKWHHS